MANIHSIQIDNNEYLIEPFMYAVAAGTGDAYTAIISNYDITANTLLFLTVPTNSLANATLSINSGTAVPIYYQNEAVTSDLLKANQTYTLTYSNGRWNILNNLSGGGSLLIDNNGGLEEDNNGLKIKTGGVTNSMIADGTITNVKLVNSIITIAGNEVSLGGSISLSDLGLTQVLHFKGVAANDTLADGSKKDPFSTATEKPNYNGDLGDVVLDIDKEFEYVWAGSTDGWIKLGGNASYKILQTTVADPTADNSTNAFIDSISQNANGEITVTKKYVSGWQYDRAVYADLTTDSTATVINGADANASAIGIGIHGILKVANGGTGSDEEGWSAGGILYGATANNVKYYTSLTGSRYQILTSGGASAPVWTEAAFLESIVNTTANARNYTTLELGNNKGLTDSTNGHSEGRLILFSSGTDAHFLYGAATNIAYTHTLPNADGILLQIPSAFAVGSNTQPVYITANGTATALTYTPNRLYYSDAAVSGETYAINFLPSNHYADDSKIGIGITTWPLNNNDTLYVDGASSFTGIVKITNNTDITSGNSSTEGALVVDGGTTIKAKLNVQDDVTFDQNLLVTLQTTLTDRVGIGTVPDANNTGDQHILSILGSTVINGTNTLAHLDVTTVNNDEVFEFRPELSSSGFIGTNTYRWKEIYAANLLNIADSNSSFIVTIEDSIGSSVAAAALTSTTPTLQLIADLGNNQQSDWSILNDAGVFTITNNANNNSIDLFGNTYGFRTQGRLYIDYEDALTNLDTFCLFVNGNSQFEGHLIPNTDNSYDLGSIDVSDNLRWRNLYLSNTFNISNLDNNTSINLSVLDTNAGIAKITLTAEAPEILLATTNITSGAEDWTIKNNIGIFTINDGNRVLQGDIYGFKISPYLYINEDVPSQNQYNLYVNGTALHTGLITLSDTQNDTAYINTITPSFYPAESNAGSLGLGGASAKRWATIFIGTADTYGDAYTPIYWLNGVPTTMTIVQKVPWSLANTHQSCKIEHSMFTSNSIIIQIVITSGESNLNAPLTWKSNTGYIAINTAIGVSGTVEGYALVIRGKEYANNTFTYTRTTSTV